MTCPKDWTTSIPWASDRSISRLWTHWSGADGARLQTFVHRAAQLWRQWIPEFSLNWFDSKAADLAHLPMTEESTRCGFGHGEIAVAPSGNLYPCERLVGEDRADQPWRLPGHALDGPHFLDFGPAGFERCEPCSQCALAVACDTSCRCSNFVRTGDTGRPDGLLCLLNKVAAQAVDHLLANPASAPQKIDSIH